MGQSRLRLKSSSIKQDELIQILKENVNHILIDYDKQSLIIECLNNKTKQDLLEDIVRLKIDVELFTHYEPSLNDIFVMKVGEEHA